MPKLSVRPTPAQARVMKVMYDDPEVELFISVSRAEWWCRNYSKRITLEKDWGKIRYSTARKIQQEEWVEQSDPDNTYFGENRYKLTETGREVAALIVEDDLHSPSVKPTTRHILDTLRLRHQFPEWVFVEELRLGTGFGYYVTSGGERIPYGRVDAFAINCWPSKKYQRVAYEVKVSRGDFLKELDNPRKRRGGMYLANYFYFAAPEGLIKPDELPDLCGLVEIRGDGFWKVKCKAIWTEAPDPTWPLIASIARTLMREEFRGR